MLFNGPLFASIRAPDFLAGVPTGLSSKTGFCPGTRNSRCYRSLNQILKLLSAEWADESVAHFSPWKMLNMEKKKHESSKTESVGLD